MNILKLDKALQGLLWSHLLPEGTIREQAAFLFSKTETADDGLVFEAVDQAFLGPDDFAAQYMDYFELTDEARIGLIKRAHFLEASLAEFHSHLSPWPAAFSLSDRMGLKETVPHMRWRLKRRPYLAAVVASSGFDALVWSRDPKIPEPLAGIDIDGVLMKPTDASLGGWDDDREPLRPE